MASNTRPSKPGIPSQDPANHTPTNTKANRPHNNPDHPLPNRHPSRRSHNPNQGITGVTHQAKVPRGGTGTTRLRARDRRALYLWDQSDLVPFPNKGVGMEATARVSMVRGTNSSWYMAVEFHQGLACESRIPTEADM